MVPTLAWRQLFAAGVALVAGGGCASASHDSADLAASPGPADGSVDGATGGDDLAAPADATAAPPDLAGWLLPPATSCAAPGDGCAAPVAVDGIWANLRKDAWLSAYSEPGDAPQHGGRVQLAARAAVGGAVTRVTIAGVDVSTILTPNPSTPPPFEWVHVWPQPLVAGAPLFVAFHARSADWDARTQSDVKIETDQGIALQGSFAVQQPTVPITYSTTSDDGKRVLVHLHNFDAKAHAVKRVLVDGADVTAAACVAQAVAPGESLLVTVNRCQAEEPGRALTVAVEYADAPAAVAVGRVLRPHFPVEAWANSDECVFPSGNAANYQKDVAAGIDAAYFYAGICGGKCTCDAKTLLTQTLPPSGFQALGAEDVAGALASVAMPDTRGLLGLAVGDESDGEIYDKNTGVPNAAILATTVDKLWKQLPDVPTFVGGKTNRNIGTFAGSTDVQGVDFHVAACAPHITPFGSNPPLRAPYDYLRNARDNQRPGPTWLYAQGLAPGWNKKRPVVGDTIHVQPDPQEILVQAMFAVAAGAKGILWFQANQEEATHAPARWQALSDAGWMVRGVRALLRTGDPTAMASTSGQAIVEAIRAPEAIVVPIIALQTSNDVTDVACAGSLLDESQVPHWHLAPQMLDVDVLVSGDFGVADVFEVRASGIVDAKPSIQGRVVRLPAVPLDDTTPVRLFVIAGSPSVRQAVGMALQH